MKELILNEYVEQSPQTKAFKYKQANTSQDKSSLFKMDMELDQVRKSFQAWYLTAFQKNMTGAAPKERSAIHYIIKPVT